MAVTCEAASMARQFTFQLALCPCADAVVHMHAGHALLLRRLQHTRCAPSSWLLLHMPGARFSSINNTSQPLTMLELF